MTGGTPVLRRSEAPSFAIPIARAVVCATLVFAPWAFGTTEPWSQNTVAVLTAVAASLAAFGSRSSSRRYPSPCPLPQGERESARAQQAWLTRNWQWRWALPLLALAIYIAVQALNASHRYRAIDQALIPQSHLAWLPHSADAAATWLVLGKLLTYAALFWTVRACFQERDQWRLLLTVLVISAFALAMFGIVQNVSGTRKLFWVRAPSWHADVFGPFVNPNNYAAYMNLLIPVTLAMGSYTQRRASERRRRSHPGYLYYFMAAVMIASVFLSKSRAAIVICVALIAGWALLNWRREQRGARRLIAPVGLLAVTAAALLWWVGIEPIQLKLARLSDTTEELTGAGGRAAAYRATLQMWSERWFYGTGAGTFSSVFPYYQPREVIGRWQYAHCDWLQCLAELGVAGSGLLLALGFGMWWRGRETQPTQRHLSFRQPMKDALILALGGVGLHAVIDFPLQIPAITLLAVAYLALVTRVPLTPRR